LFGGNDTIIGSAFNDVLFAGGGTNTINGGAGTDTVNYSGSYNDALLNIPATANSPAYSGFVSQGVTVDLAVGIVTIGHVENWASPIPTLYSRDTLISIENIVGSKIHYDKVGDTLSGNAGANTIWGLAGDDSLDGRAGDDTLNGGAGDDILNGGTGIDTADYQLDGFAGSAYFGSPYSPGGWAASVTTTSGVIVDLVAGQSWDNSVGGGFGHDTLISIENVTGSYANDWISGTGTANVLNGMDGNDTIYGLGGDDKLIGGAGNDGLYGGLGNDRIEGGLGVDYMEGGDGNDYLLDDSTGNVVAHEWSAMYGGNGNDTLESRGLGDNGMFGDAGSDTFLFGAGTSYATGGAGADIFGFGADPLISSTTANFAQINDFQLGVDHIHLTGTATVKNWGANTGIDILTSTGAHETIMLMGITSAQLTATAWTI
jgi:Ca2+-binding RTX toxin-like protein